MLKLDAFVYRQMWQYCWHKNKDADAKAIFQKYTLPHPLRQVGHFQLSLVAGEQVVRIPRLSSIARKPLKLSYPPHPYLLKGRDYVLPYTGPTDECWWDQHIWTG